MNEEFDENKDIFLRIKENYGWTLKRFNEFIRYGTPNSNQKNSNI
jgi:hypothetical protein